MYRFPANYVDSCPLNKTSWENASINLNCSRDASRLNRYHCVPNQQRSAVIEFCYDKFSGRYEKETCIRLYDNGYLHSVSCKTFSYGCPTTSYLGDEIYKFPACLQIDPMQKCYLADNLCVTPTSETTHSGTTIGQENETSYNTSTAVVYNQITHNVTSDNSSNPNFIVPIVTSLCVIALVIAVLLIIRRRCRRKKKDLMPSEILNLGEDGIQNYLQQLQNGKVKVYHARGMIVGCAGAGKTSLLERLKGKSAADIRHIKSSRSVDIQSDIFAVDGNKISVVSENERISHFDLNQSNIMRTQNVEDVGFSRHNLQNDSDTDIETTALLDVNEDERKLNIIQETETKPVVIQTDKDQDVVNIEVDEDSSNTVSERQSSDNRDEYIKQPIATLEPIQEFEFLSGKKSPKTITFSDFAGQLAYYVTHEIFLNQRAFYLLVIDLSKDLDERIDEGEMFKLFTYRGVIEHWMKLIYAVHSCAPIILVGTHAKGYKKQDVKEVFKTVWSLMPHQRQIYVGREFAVELLEQENDPGIEEIKNCICKVLVDPGPGREHITWGEERPTSWVKYEDYLGKVREKNKIIRTEDLWDTIEKEKSNTKLRTEEDMRYMLQFFHDTGAVLFFDEVSLREYIVLDVPWFVGAFKHIISDVVHTTEDLRDLKKTFKGNHNEALQNLQTYGILTLNLLRAVWNLYDASYEPLLDVIMMYMERLGMIAGMTTDHKNKNQDTWYIPCLNKKSLLDVNFDGFVFSSSLCFQFEFLPASVYYRLVATCLNKLGLKIRNWPKPKYVYKDAVFLHDNFEEFECYTLIRHMNEENAIEVQILSQKSTEIYKQTASMLKQELLKHLNTLMKSFHCNLGKINIGYRCRIRSPGMKSKAHILSESDFARRPISCPECNSLQEINGDICSYWNQDATQDNNEVQSKVQTRKANDDSNTDVGGSVASQGVTFILEASLHVPGISRCWHISCVSPESAWVSDDDGRLRHVDTHGKVINTVSGRQTLQCGSHTVTKDGVLMFIGRKDNHVYRVAGEKQIPTLQTDQCEPRCIFSSPRNGDLLIGGRYRDDRGYYNKGVVMRYNASGGTHKQEIKRDKAGCDLYKQPNYITENMNGDVIVSDFRRVVVVDKSGRLRFAYTGYPSGSGFSPRGVCTDTSGLILVCGYLHSKSVHTCILTLDGEFLSPIQTPDHGIETPRSICMDNEERVWVGDGWRNRVCIYRYQAPE